MDFRAHEFIAIKHALYTIKFSKIKNIRLYNFILLCELNKAVQNGDNKRYPKPMSNNDILNEYKKTQKLNFIIYYYNNIQI